MVKWSGTRLWRNKANSGERDVQNKPNFGWPRCPTLPIFHHSSVPAECGSCKTNPISPRERAWGRGLLYKQTQFPPPMPILRSAFPGGNRAKQTQLAPGRRERQVLYGQRVMGNWTCDGLRQNKANCPKRGTQAVSGSRDGAGETRGVVYRVKQTQSGGVSNVKCQVLSPASRVASPWGVPTSNSTLQLCSRTGTGGRA